MKGRGQLREGGSFVCFLGEDGGFPGIQVSPFLAFMVLSGHDGDNCQLS